MSYIGPPPGLRKYQAGLIGAPPGNVELPELPGPLDPKEAGPLAPLERTPSLDQLALPHHPQHPLAIDRDPQLAPHEGGDHPVAVALVLLRDLDDRLLDRIDGRPSLRRLPRLRCAVERLSADPCCTRHCRERVARSDEITGAGDAHAQFHSRPGAPSLVSLTTRS